MSLCWLRRLDKYRKDIPAGLHEITIQITKRPGLTITCDVKFDKLTYLEEDDCYLHETLDHDFRFFENMSCCLEFTHRYIKRWTFSVDCLENRTYYFGRQIMHYQKEVE